MLLLVRWHMALQPRLLISGQVGASYVGMLARASLYPPHWLWPGQAQHLLEMVLAGLPSTPDGLAERALIEGANGQSAQARHHWSEVKGKGWPVELAGFYLAQRAPQELPPPGFFRDQYELDAGLLSRAEMESRAQHVAGVISTVALLAAVSFTASLLALLSLPWWAARWHEEFSSSPPPVEGALGAFLGWQLLAMLLVPGLVHGLPDPARMFVAQTLLYVLGLALLQPLRPWRELRPTPALLALGVTGYWLCLPGALLAGWLTKLLGFSPQSVNPALKLVLDSQGWQIAIMGFLVAVAGPCFEELLFRGTLYRSWRGSLGPRRAMLASALLFAVVHADPAMVLPLGTLGLIFAWLTERSGSLVPSMVAHSFWNGATFLLLTLSRGG